MLIYAPMLQRILGFSWRALASIYLRSLIATGAAVAPVLVSYALWNPATAAGPLQRLSMAGVGGIVWLITLRLVGHPLFAEIIGMLEEITATLRKRKPARSAL